MIKRLCTVVLGFLLMGLAGGCARYFFVQEPAGGREYYTNNVEEQPSGAVRFTDLKTGSRVTLQSSVVKEVKEADLPPDLAKK